MSTAAFFAAGRVIDALTELARPGRPLDGVQVSYSWPGNISQKCVYLGELPFTQVKGPTAGADDTLVAETGTVTLYVRVVQPFASLPDGGDAVRLADSAADTILNVIGGYVRANSATLLGPNTDLFQAGGNRQYGKTDDEAIVSVRFDLTFTCFIGGA